MRVQYFGLWVSCLVRPSTSSGANVSTFAPLYFSCEHLIKSAETSATMHNIVGIICGTKNYSRISQ